MAMPRYRYKNLLDPTHFERFSKLPLLSKIQILSEAEASRELSPLQLAELYLSTDSEQCYQEFEKNYRLSISTSQSNEQNITFEFGSHNIQGVMRFVENEEHCRLLSSELISATLEFFKKKIDRYAFQIFILKNEGFAKVYLRKVEEEKDDHSWKDMLAKPDSCLLVLKQKFSEKTEEEGTHSNLSPSGTPSSS